MKTSKILFPIWIFFISSFLFLKEGYSSAEFAIQTGDVLLLSEHGVHTSYIHSGVIVFDRLEDTFYVLESTSSEGVIKTPLKNYSSKDASDQKVLIVRAKEMNSSSELDYLAQELLDHFNKNMLGHSYNFTMVWNSINQQGNRDFYCSELTLELLNMFLKNKIRTHPMQFENPIWDTLFSMRGFKVPRGELGISPGDFLDEKWFYPLGQLNKQQPNAAGRLIYHFSSQGFSVSSDSSDSLGEDRNEQDYHYDWEEEKVFDDYLGFGT